MRNTILAHYLQHVPFEGLGSIKNWLVNEGCSITSTKLYESAVFPDVSGIDLLIVFGGIMSVNDVIDFFWLVEEKKFIRSAIVAGKPVLGICLGAQLIAAAMGSKVYPNPERKPDGSPYKQFHQTMVPFSISPIEESIPLSL